MKTIKSNRRYFVIRTPYGYSNITEHSNSQPLNAAKKYPRREAAEVAIQTIIEDARQYLDYVINKHPQAAKGGGWTKATRKFAREQKVLFESDFRKLKVVEVVENEFKQKGHNNHNLEGDLIMEGPANALDLTRRENQLWTALDQADTAFAVLNTVDLSGNPQARAALVKAWKDIQDLKAEILGPNSVYAEAVRISREKDGPDKG